MKILYHHRTASKDGQAVHIEEMIDAMRTRLAKGALDTITRLDLTRPGNARRVVMLAQSVRG